VAESVRAASYDLVIADVFAGAVTPAHLTTAEFAAATARALRPGGVYAVNVAAGQLPSAGAPPRESLSGARSAVATVRSVYKETAMIAESSVLRGRRRGNLVILASDQPLPEQALARAVAGDPFPARVVAGEDLLRFISGAPVVTDIAVTANPPAPSEASPQSTNW
jgi:spermidine synthase